ncbi:MAG: hypothetical protein ACFFAU_18280 [Candidatus Hodarchaeota archaeon]
MSEESQQLSNTEISQNSSAPPKVIPWASFAYALLIAPLSSFFILLLLTSGIGVIARENWPSNTILWPQAIYISGTLGGLLGGCVVCWEIWMNFTNDRPITPSKLFSSDLLYIMLLFLLTYLLEFLSESISLQGLFFVLEMAFFLVIGRNISKFTLEKPNTQKKSGESLKDSDS